MTTDITRLKTSVTVMNLPKITLFLLAALVSPMASLAQDATGRIFGTVYDQQSAVVPGVRITVTNTPQPTTKDRSRFWRCRSGPTR